MKIENKGKIDASEIKKKKKAGGSSSSFVIPGESGGSSSSASSVGGTSFVSSVDSLLALQSVGGVGDEGSSEAKRHAHDLLDHLDAIRHGLLLGFIPQDRLQHLANLSQTMPKTADPRLAEILNEIELRARVEIAKLKQSS